MRSVDADVFIEALLCKIKCIRESRGDGRCFLTERDILDLINSQETLSKTAGDILDLVNPQETLSKTSGDISDLVNPQETLSKTSGDISKPIYVVVKGHYSDYHILTATTNKLLAERIKGKFDEEYRRTDIEVFSDAEIFLKSIYRLEFDVHGNLVEAKEGGTDSDYYNNYEMLNHDGSYYTYVVADDLESAIKIGAEKRAVYLSLHCGI